MSHRGRSAQLCPEKERGETDRLGDRAAVSLRVTLSSRVKNRQHFVSVSEKWLFYEETKGRLRSGSVYSCYDTNLLKHNPGENYVIYFEELVFFAC